MCCKFWAGSLRARLHLLLFLSFFAFVFGRAALARLDGSRRGAGRVFARQARARQRELSFPWYFLGALGGQRPDSFYSLTYAGAFAARKLRSSSPISLCDDAYRSRTILRNDRFAPSRSLQACSNCRRLENVLTPTQSPTHIQSNCLTCWCRESLCARDPPPGWITRRDANGDFAHD